jgi:tRNA nucleotidyltransferase (CCA-adding enzyme)
MARRPASPTALSRARLPRELLGVLRRLDRGGHRSWVVGGAVRDLLLGRPHRADFDLATPAKPERVMELFPRSVPTGVEHGTVTVLVPGRLKKVEVTTFRGEGDYRDGRRPSSVTFLDDVDADLARRDFTINAMAWDPLAPAFRDPFGGAADLKARTVRAVGDAAARFAEDGLRPLRAVRLAAQLGFALDAPTRRAMRAALPVVARVSAERVRDELSKILEAAEAGRGLALLEETGLLGVVLPELAAQPRGDRAHALAAARAVRGAASVRLAALLHAAAAREPAPAVARRAREALSRLRFPALVSEEVEALVREHGCLRAPGRPPPPAGGAEVRRLLSRIGPFRAADLLELREADAAALPARRARAVAAAAAELRERVGRVLAERPPLSQAQLRIDGREVMAELGLEPGREVGEALRHLLDRVLEDPRLNTPRALRAELRSWWGGPDS